ncbi:MAG TPA: NAD-dependent epimerase/dehydratase family protein [archaeon]|nr:NAD-dependent epimerase/dehydratase family protein [archaeon]
MVILVTGATGRIGKNLIKALAKEKGRVRALVRNTEPMSSGNVDIVRGDILDRNSLDEAMYGVTTVFHLAAVVDYLAPKKQTYDVNVTGTKNVMEAAPGRKIIHMSSTSVYGSKQKQMPIDENTPTNPTDYYGQTKLMGEEIAREHGATILRSTDVYGPGFTEGFYEIIRMTQKGKMYLIGDGKNIIHYVYYKDLIDALLLAKDKGKRGEAYVIAGKESKTLVECLALIARHLNVHPPQKRISKPVAKALVLAKFFAAKSSGERPKIIPAYIDKLIASRLFSIEKAKQELGYSPKVGYEEGIAETVKDFLKRSTV